MPEPMWVPEPMWRRGRERDGDEDGVGSGGGDEDGVGGGLGDGGGGGGEDGGGGGGGGGGRTQWRRGAANARGAHRLRADLLGARGGL